MLRVNLLFYFLLSVNWSFSQKSYQYTLKITPESCLKGEASLAINGYEQKDSLLIYWSNGISNTLSINNLNANGYFVQTKIIHHHDSVRIVTDSILFFKVEKEICGILIDNYFSPNDDGYHDILGIVNAEYYPNFEFVIFNKWGQQIHNQKNTYKPWDGKWQGVDVPDGSYYYIFFFDVSNKNNMVKGNVTILR